jgi:hypothetical protein
MIGKRLRTIIKGSKIYNNPDNRQANPYYKECPFSPIKHASYQRSQRKAYQYPAYNITKSFYRFIVLRQLKAIISRIKRWVVYQPNANKTVP